METIINMLIALRTKNFIDERTANLLAKDPVYQTDMRDLADLESQVHDLNIDKQANYLIQDYVACMESAQERARELTYFTAVKDVVEFFVHTSIGSP